MAGKHGKTFSLLVKNAFHAALFLQHAARHGMSEWSKKQDGRPFQIAFRRLEVKKERVPGFGAESGKKALLLRTVEKAQGKAADGQNFVSFGRKNRIVGRASVSG